MQNVSSGQSTSHAPARVHQAPKVVARRYQAHLPGLVYVVLTVLLVLGAVNSQNNLLFAIFGLAVAGIVVSGIVSGGAIMGLRVTREVVGPVEAGRDIRVRYRVKNINWLIPSGGLLIEEVEADRWGRHKSTWHNHAASISAYIPWVGARQEVVVEGIGTTSARGRATLNLLRITTTFPFGLTRKYVLFSQPDEIVIRPWIAPMPQGTLLRSGGGTETSRSRRSTRGSEGEFFAIRDYTPGDSPRAVAWRASARRGHLVVRELAQHDNRRLEVGIFLGSLKGPARERFISATAGLVTRELAQGAEVSLISGDQRVRTAGGPRQRERVLDLLAGLPTSTSEPIPTDRTLHHDPLATGHLTVRPLNGGDLSRLDAAELERACTDWSASPTLRVKPAAKSTLTLRQLWNRLASRRATNGGDA